MPEPRIVLRKRIVREENDRLGKNPHPKGMIKHFEYADKARFNLAKKIAETISENEHERQKIEQFLIQGKKATGELLRLRDPELRKKIEEEIDALSHFHQFSDANLMRHITGEGESDFIEQILDKFKGIVVREEFLERKGIAESLKYMRGTDRILSRGIHNTYYNGRNLSDYDAISGINIIGLVNELLKKGNA
ncbi:MAG: hypothetical protein Q7K42_03680, partial [Candidatus Diapherotrites archaeon]|nr:hypothetical protein [Candidatus Diapherotrites archaeon]